jgi:hypothetical protein
MASGFQFQAKIGSRELATRSASAPIEVRAEVNTERMKISRRSRRSRRSMQSSLRAAFRSRLHIESTSEQPGLSLTQGLRHRRDSTAPRQRERSEEQGDGPVGQASAPLPRARGFETAVYGRESAVESRRGCRSSGLDMRTEARHVCAFAHIRGHQASLSHDPATSTSSLWWRRNSQRRAHHGRDPRRRDRLPRTKWPCACHRRVADAQSESAMGCVINYPQGAISEATLRGTAARCSIRTSARR